MIIVSERYREIAKVYSVKEANEYCAKGWELINSYVDGNVSLFYFGRLSNPFQEMLEKEIEKEKSE